MLAVLSGGPALHAEMKDHVFDVFKLFFLMLFVGFLVPGGSFIFYVLLFWGRARLSGFLMDKKPLRIGGVRQ